MQFLMSTFWESCQERCFTVVYLQKERHILGKLERNFKQKLFKRNPMIVANFLSHLSNYNYLARVVESREALTKLARLSGKKHRNRDY